MRRDIKEKRVICPTCEGTGGLIAYKKDGGKGVDRFQCTLCDGKGVVLRRVIVSYFPIGEDENKEENL